MASSWMYCDTDASQCFDGIKILSTIIVLVGVIGFSAVKNRQDIKFDEYDLELLLDELDKTEK